MMSAPLSALAHWTNFYVIVGSSAGALTGLQFVVITLVSEARATGGMGEIRAFGTPTVVHFCAALLVSVIMCAPWYDPVQVAICFGIAGILGFAYSVRVIRHAYKQTGYSPDGGDWLWFTIIPLLSYAALGAAGILMVRNADAALFLIAAISVLLLFTGIHNAWDTVTYVAVEHPKNSNEPRSS